jgi:hypothetical protein
VSRSISAALDFKFSVPLISPRSISARSVIVRFRRAMRCLIAAICSSVSFNLADAFIDLQARAQNNRAGEQQGFRVPQPGPIHDEFVRDASKRAQTVIGNGQCVTACQHFAPGLRNIPTWRWTQGPSVSTLTDADKGTAIATFVKRRYPESRHHDKNSGIFLSTEPNKGIWILDLWPP